MPVWDGANLGHWYTRKEMHDMAVESVRAYKHPSDSLPRPREQETRKKPLPANWERLFRVLHKKKLKDREIAVHFARTSMWACYVRRKLGLPANAKPSGKRV